MRRAFAYLALVVVASGCAFGEIWADYGEPVDMRPSDLVGTWQSGAHGRSIVFEEDGDFSASDLPYGEFRDFLPAGFDPATDQIDGAGTWSLEASRPDGPTATVDLLFRRLAGVAVAGGHSLSAMRQDDGRVLLFFFYVERGNSWTSYQRCELDCPFPWPSGTPSPGR